MIVAWTKMVVATEVMRSGRTVSLIGTFNNFPIAKLKELTQRCHLLKFKVVSITALFHLSYFLTRLYYVISCSLTVAPCFIFSAYLFLSQLKSFPFQILSPLWSFFLISAFFPSSQSSKIFFLESYSHILVHMVFIFCLSNWLLLFFLYCPP